MFEEDKNEFDSSLVTFAFDKTRVRTIIFLHKILLPTGQTYHTFAFLMAAQSVDNDQGVIQVRNPALNSHRAMNVKGDYKALTREIENTKRDILNRSKDITVIYDGRVLNGAN